MKIVLNKLNVVRPVTKPEDVLPRKAWFTRETAKKSTTSGSTGLVVLIMLGLLLSQSMRIELGNPKDTNGNP